MANTFDKEESPMQDISFKYLDEAVWNRLRISYTGLEGTRTDGGSYTNLGLMLSDECPWKTEVLTSKGNALVLDGPIIKQYYDALEILKCFGGSMPDKKYMVEKYPAKILREALVNAFVHRDYSDGAPVTISAGRDTVEISSPGGIWVPETCTHEDLYNIRNSEVARFFRAMEGFGFRGNGITTIKQYYKLTPQVPTVSFDDSSFTMRLPAISAISNKYEVRTEKVASIIRTFRGASVRTIADNTLFSTQYVRRLLKRMEADGIVFSTGCGKKNIYYLYDYGDCSGSKQTTLFDRWRMDNSLNATPYYEPISCVPDIRD